MATQQTADRTAESFQGLLLRHRGRTGLTQRQLAAHLGVSRGSVQDWEAGLKYPDAQHLRALLVAFLDAGGLTIGSEITEAEALWAAALRQASRMQTPFDGIWWAELLAGRAESRKGKRAPPSQQPIGATSATRTTERRQDWGDAPDVLNFLGRVKELEALRDLVLEEGCRLVGLFGMGGIGKTMLAARLARDLASSFERTYWRSLRNAPTPSDWLGGAIAFLSAQQFVPPDGEAARLRMLLELLREHHCLLVLDNLEALLKPGDLAGNYLDGYDGYGELLQVLGQSAHQSCLIFTSREAPPELVELGGQHAPVHVLTVGGLSVAEARALLSDKHLHGDAAAWADLVVRYGGNGLALKIVGETIDQVFGGEIAAFLEQSSSTMVFGGIQRLLDGQVERLSTLERDVLWWLGIEREPVTFSELATDMGPSVRRGDVIEAVEALRRRSVVERPEPGSAFTLPSAVLGYVTDCLVDRCADEIQTCEPALLATHTMVKAQAKDYVRRSQERLIAEPIVSQLLAICDGPQAVEQRLIALLDQVRRTPIQEHGAVPGNLVNLLRLVRGDLRGVDLSGLEIRQAYLQEMEAQDASLGQSHLSGAVLGEAFNHPTCVALSEDGVYLAAGTSTGEVCVWRVADRTLIGTLRGHTSMILGLALSPNGSLLASGGYDGPVRLWDARSGRLLATLAGHVGGAMSVALSHDGRVVASGGYDGSVKLWEAHDGRLLMTVAAHGSGVRGIALTADGSLVASGGMDGTVKLTDANTGQLIATLEGHTSGVRGVALSADGRLVVSGSEDGTVRLWSLDMAKANMGARTIAVLQGHTGCVWSVALAQDGRTLASISEDGTVRLWDPASGQMLAALPGHTASWGVALSRDGRLVASSSFEGMVRLWDVPSGRVLASLEGRAGGAWGVAVRADGSIVASGGFDGTVRLWDAASGRLLHDLKGHTGGVRGVALAASANVLASGSEDGSVRLWDTCDGRQLHVVRGHRGGVRCVALSDDGQLVASGGSDATVRLKDTKSGGELLTLRGHRGGVWGVSLSGDGRLLASGSEDQTLKLWEAASGRLLATFECDMGGVWGVALSRDGRRVASGSDDGTVRLWDTTTGRVVATFGGHTGGVWGVAISADGRLAASGTFDGVVRIWDVDDERLTATLEGHTGGVWCVGMSGDGQVVASGSFEGSLRLWNGTTGTSLRTLVGDRRYERLDITGLSGITEAQRDVMRALGAVEKV